MFQQFLKEIILFDVIHVIVLKIDLLPLVEDQQNHNILDVKKLLCCC